MNFFNYKIIEYDEHNVEHVIFQLNNSNIYFANITPMTRANHVLNVYGSTFIDNEELINQYDGTFSFNSQNTLYTDSLALQVDQLFNALMDCEQNKRTISIYVQAADENILTEYAKILNHAQIELVIKTLKIEQKNVIGLLNMVYKNIE